MPRSSWRGAIEFAGFPVNVALYPSVKSVKNESFRTIAPDGKPVRQVYIDSSDAFVDRGDTRKGVEVSKNNYVVLTDDQVNTITAAERSDVLPVSYFAPLSSIPLELASQAFSVEPDTKVAGSEKSVSLLWSMLKASGTAYCTKGNLRSGSPDQILVIYAGARGLVGVSLPFQSELNETDSNLDEVEGAGDLFSKFVKEDDIKSFSFDDFQSDYKTRRQSVIDALVSGEDVPVTETTSTPQVADLLSLLEGAAA